MNFKADLSQVISQISQNSGKLHPLQKTNYLPAHCFASFCTKLHKSELTNVKISKNLLLCKWTVVVFFYCLHLLGTRKLMDYSTGEWDGRGGREHRWSEEGTKGKWRDSTAVLRATCGTHDDGCLSYCLWRNNSNCIWNCALFAYWCVHLDWTGVMGTVASWKCVHNDGVFETSVT